MDWIKELLWAVGMVGIPVGVLTLAIVWWAMRNGHLTGETDGKAVELKLKAMNKKKKKNKGEVDKRDFFSEKVGKIRRWLLRSDCFLYLCCRRNYRSH